MFACWRDAGLRRVRVWLNPLAIRAQYRMLNKVAAAQMTANVEPRVFQEQFTNDNTVLYVDDVKSGRRTGGCGRASSSRISRRPPT